MELPLPEIPRELHEDIRRAMFASIGRKHDLLEVLENRFAEIEHLALAYKTAAEALYQVADELEDACQEILGIRHARIQRPVAEAMCILFPVMEPKLRDFKPVESISPEVSLQPEAPPSMG